MMMVYVFPELIQLFPINNMSIMWIENIADFDQLASSSQLITVFKRRFEKSGKTDSSEIEST